MSPRLRPLLVFALALATALAGCAADQEDGTGTPTPGTTGTPTPQSPTPQSPTPTSPTTPGGATGDATGVALTLTPVRASDNATVCWRVEGTGRVPHVAIHFDDESHPEATSFTQYDLGAMYPDNLTAADPAGYDLPGDFCTAIPVDDEPVYYRGHVIDADGPPGVLSEEGIVQPAGEAASIEVTTFEANATAGEDTLVCWRIDGEGNVPHVAVHFDNESHPEATSFTQYDLGAKYPNNLTAAAADGYNLPGDFCTTVTREDAGPLYLRAHFIDRRGPPGMLSDEVQIVFA